MYFSIGIIVSIELLGKYLLVILFFFMCVGLIASLTLTVKI